MTAHCMAVTAQEIADRTVGQIEGDGSRAIRRVETVDNAEPDVLA